MKLEAALYELILAQVRETTLYALGWYKSYSF